MKKSHLLACVAATTLCLSVPALVPSGPLGSTPAAAQSVSVDFELFFNELEPHGVWVRHPQHRYVFCPTGVDTSWRPYTDGRWIYLADHGWYFSSEEPFAWATYHYGRWLDDDNLGWCWVPGTEWAPAWVSWRRSDTIVGWAPLPPEGEGYAVSVEVTREDLPEPYWVYVPTDRFVEPQLSVSIVFGSDEPDYYAQTEFLGPVTVEGDVVVNNVIDVTYIEQQVNQEIVVYETEEAASPNEAAVTSERVQIFAQDIAEPEEDVAPTEAVGAEEASAVIESEGGTNAARPEEAEQPEDHAAPTEGVAPEADGEAAPEPEEPPVTNPASDNAPSNETSADEPAEDPAAEDAPAAEDSTAQEPADEAPPAEEPEPQEPAADEPAAEELATEESAADQPVAEEPVSEEPAAEEPAAEEATPGSAEVAPVPEEAPMRDDAPAAEEAAPAPEEAAPAALETAPADAEAAPEGELAAAECPPEQQLVDGACVPVETAPAQ